MSKVATLRRAPARRSPERAALAEAVGRHNAAARALAELEAAEAKMLARIADARVAVSRANEAVEAAKVEAAHAAAAGKPVPSARAARQAAEDAEDALAALLAGREELKAQLPGARNRRAVARINLDDFVRAVVAADPSVKKLLAECDRAGRAFVDLYRACQRLGGDPAPLDWNGAPGPLATAAAGFVAAIEHDADAQLEISARRRAF